MWRILLAGLIAVVSGGSPHAQPCEDRTCDEHVVQGILDLNGVARQARYVVWPDTGRVRDMDLSGLWLNTVPGSIGRLSALRSAELSANRILSLPDSIRYLTELRVLHLSNNFLQHLPDGIVSLTNLSGLFLAYNNLIDLPDSIG